MENIQKLPPYNGDSELKDAALPLFEMYFNAMDVEYREIVDLLLRKILGKRPRKESIPS